MTRPEQWRRLLGMPPKCLHAILLVERCPLVLVLSWRLWQDVVWVQLELTLPHVAADVGPVTECVQIVVHLRQHIQTFVPRELRDGQDVERLAPPLLQRVIHQHGICLIPLSPRRRSRMRPLQPLIGPNPRQPLIALHPRIVIRRRQAEGIPCPDEHAALDLGRTQELVDHVTDVVRAGGGPDDDVEGVEAVGEEVAGVGALYEVGGAFPGGAVEEGAVEVDYDEDTARGGEEGGRTECLGEVFS